MKIKPMAAVLCAVLALPARAAGTDLASDAGMKETCAGLAQAQPAKLARDDERTAHAICASLVLATDAAQWWRGLPPVGIATPADFLAARRQLESYLARLTVIRTTLERVHARGPILRVAPGTWAVDFDGDGQVSLQERYFFWAPKRGMDVAPFARAHDEATYRAAYEPPVVNVDQADVYWALAYCNFAEAALHLVLSYDFRQQPREEFVLVDGDRVRRQAYARMREGVRYSLRLRAALLAETDDDHEWIANPRQHDTSFPLAMDAQTFETWGAALAQLQEMLEGRALYGGRIENGRGVTDLTFGSCAAGQGIDVRDLLLHPLVHPLDRAEIASRCTASTKQKPMTTLASIAAGSIRRHTTAQQGLTGEWQVLRHLYWVN